MGYTNGKCSLKRASCKRSASVIGSLLVQDVSRWLEQERNSWSWPTALAEALQTQLQKCSWLFSPPSEPFPLWRKFLFPVVWMQQQFATTLFTFSAAVKAFFPPITNADPTGRLRFHYMETWWLWDQRGLVLSGGQGHGGLLGSLVVPASGPTFFLKWNFQCCSFFWVWVCNCYPSKWKAWNKERPCQSNGVNFVDFLAARRWWSLCPWVWKSHQSSPYVQGSPVPLWMWGPEHLLWSPEPTYPLSLEHLSSPWMEEIQWPSGITCHLAPRYLLIFHQTLGKNDTVSAGFTKEEGSDPRSCWRLAGSFWHWPQLWKREPKLLD